jgi:predicted transcriptional regulator of viral defense system
MKVSSVELTALDLLRYPRAAGGIDHIATVLADLGEKIDAERLGLLSGSFERSVVQRLGYLLRRVGYEDRTAAMHQKLFGGVAPGWAELDRSEAGTGSEPVERDQRWRVVVRRAPEIDE